MRRLLTRITPRFRKDRAGQSIVLLAIGFIALIAFVGLVTDLSLLFVRYSALRRTVDASAIAAAGQIREGRDFGDVAIAARQYIELHGLEPSRVFVETCETDIDAWRQGRSPYTQPHPEASYALSQMPETELCRWSDPRKLVRVTAQIDSPTTFLKLIGWNDIALEATSVSETAVLDVALVLDTSESMVNETSVAQYTNVGLNNATMRAECYVPVTDPITGQITPDINKLRWPACCDDPGQAFVRLDTATGFWVIYTDLNANGQEDPGEAGVRPLPPNSRALADGKLNDLICEPFKQVKDAARNFIRSLDYVRGDRVTLVTFDRLGKNITPIGVTDPTLIMMSDEQQAMVTLDERVGVGANVTVGGVTYTNQTGWYGRCNTIEISRADQMEAPPLDTRDINGIIVNPQSLRYWSYESLAPCPDTNHGGGIKAASNALTNVATIRRDAVWVMIVLSDGAATATDADTNISSPNYGSVGFCPWNTFCNTNPSDLRPIYAECTHPPNNGEPSTPFCNDDDPLTRHFCLGWSTDPVLNGRPIPGNPECGRSGNYDADDFARDWADFAGLQEVIPNVDGNFIAIFSIGFGVDIANSDVGAPLMRYLADAGDNGQIDDDIQQDLRDDGQVNSSVTYGQPGPCQGITDPEEWCGQYYFATDLRSLNAVFESIASRLFTRLSR
jgi:hypothetical protein